MSRVIALALVLLVLLPGQALAQSGHDSRSLPEIAEVMATCLRDRLGMPVTTYDVRYGQLIEVRLKGDPSQDIQDPWPQRDSVMFVVLTLENEEPAFFRERAFSLTEHAESVWYGDVGQYVVARQHGWFNYGLSRTNAECLAAGVGLL